MDVRLRCDSVDLYGAAVTRSDVVAFRHNSPIRKLYRIASSLNLRATRKISNFVSLKLEKNTIVTIELEMSVS